MTQKFPDLVYTRPEFDTLLASFSENVEAFKNAKSYSEAKEIMAKITFIREEFSSYRSIASIRNSINTADEFYKAENDFFDEKGPVFGEVEDVFYKALCISPFRAEIETEYGSQIFVIAELASKTFIPEILEDLQEEAKLCSKYQEIKAKAKIEFDGKTYNLTGISVLTESLDRDIRKRASKAVSEFYAANAESFDSIFDTLVKLRHSMAQKMGYDNYVELGYIKMLRSDYSSKEVAKYRELIHKYVVPLAGKVHEMRKKNLGYETMFNYDSLYFHDGNPTPKGTPEQIIESGRIMYDEMSPETSEFFNFMLYNDLLDLVNKENKAGGGYCSSIPNQGAPFIFSNFNGTAHDVDVLTHEAGHAFQCYSSKDQPLMEYYWPTYEACEIHSMSMEFFAWPWVESFFKEDTAKYKYYHLVKSLVFLPYGAAVDEFQHIIYENPTMTPAERNTAWRDCEKKYLPNKKYDGDDFLENGGFWQRQAHIYQSPFYYIDYTLAQICAFQYWIKMQDNYKEAWNEYKTLCAAGGSKSFLDLVKLANLNSPFEEATFVKVVSRIEEALVKLYEEVGQIKGASN